MIVYNLKYPSKYQGVKSRIVFNVYNNNYSEFIFFVFLSYNDIIEDADPNHKEVLATYINYHKQNNGLVNVNYSMHSLFSVISITNYFKYYSQKLVKHMVNFLNDRVRFNSR